MSKAGALIEKKVKAFASGMEARMNTLRAAKVKEIDKKLEAEAKKAKKPDPKAKKEDPKAKAPTGEDKVMKLTFIMSKSPATKNRTGKQQALEVAEGDSSVCTGSHMSDSARHINMYRHGPGKKGKAYLIDPKKAFGADEEHICTVAKYKSEWVAEMKKHDLRNYGQGKGYGDGDDYHLELPNSRIPRTDPECVSCVDEYCRLVVMESDKYKHNTTFERNWSKEIKAPMAKYVKEKEKLEKAARLEELKNMRFSGKITGSGKFFTKVKDTKKATITGKGAILPPADIVKEAATKIPIILPFAGVPKKGTFTDVTVFGMLHLWFIQYENLSQTFIKEAKLDCTATFSGLLSYAATSTATGSIDISLGSGLEPLGKAVIEYSIDGIGSDDHTGKITWDIKGLKTKLLKAT